MSSVSNEDQLTLMKRPVKFYRTCGRLGGEPFRSVLKFFLIVRILELELIATDILP